ncbi:GntR family transcriptional regulator [Ferdinandcohnia quinoae]|uniref:GntR family transcriptional regulator n=1 Tax=Fredinandcohnia quinoae TaxID=2918902 RepID=A0AAW5EDP3_9BACI|nr:GntR family transcriptional regulator [Fredinandcohnia sp. SECRCQ15]MCH1627273.1 GntR family transcriptional regulator [Fredinandcohnia sp. SECRCQ15]
MIDKSSPVPIYYQLEQEIRKQIESKELRPGDMIPSEREYAEEYQISRMTVRQALNNLVNEGLLQRERGKGTFVALKKFEKNVKGLTSFSEDMRSRGLEPETRVLDFAIINADSLIASKLEIREDASVYQIKRLRLADKLPIAYEIFYMAVDLVPGLTQEIAEHSIYQFVENVIGLHIVSGVQELEATVAYPEEAEALNINEGAPVLYIQQKSIIEGEKPLEFVQSFYRADRYKYKVEMVR